MFTSEFCTGRKTFVNMISDSHLRTVPRNSGTFFILWQKRISKKTINLLHFVSALRLMLYAGMVNVVLTTIFNSTIEVILFF